MRRRLSPRLVLVGLFCVSMFLLAGPVLATESSSEETHSEEMTEDAEHSEETETHDEVAEDTGTDFTGVTTAMIAGILLGGLAFAMSNPGGIERVSAHDDH